MGRDTYSESYTSRQEIVPLDESTQAGVKEKPPLPGALISNGAAYRIPRIRCADPHRLRPPAGVLARSLQTLRVCLTLAPSRVRAQARGTKKPGYRGSRAAAFGADNGARTRDPNLGKVVLYQLSHVRICKTKRAPERPDVAWRRSPDSNRG